MLIYILKSFLMEDKTVGCEDSVIALAGLFMGSYPV